MVAAAAVSIVAILLLLSNLLLLLILPPPISVTIASELALSCLCDANGVAVLVVKCLLSS